MLTSFFFGIEIFLDPLGQEKKSGNCRIRRRGLPHAGCMEIDTAWTGIFTTLSQFFFLCPILISLFQGIPVPVMFSVVVICIGSL